MKKKAYIQLMVVRIASYLNWDFLELNDSPALQLLLLETLIQGMPLSSDIIFLCKTNNKRLKIEHEHEQKKKILPAQ